MRKIIDGKLYDTSTAKVVGSYSHGDPREDIDWAEVTLYRDKTGTYFLHEMGGLGNGYPVQQTSGSIGEDITCCSNADAMEWARVYL